MTASLNSITLLGNVGRDPEPLTSRNGSPVKITICTNDRVKYNGEYQDRKAWHSVLIVGQSAEFAARYIKKGDLVAVQGRLDYGEFEKNGVKVRPAQIISFDLKKISSPQRTNGNNDRREPQRTNGNNDRREPQRTNGNNARREPQRTSQRDAYQEDEYPFADVPF